MDSIRNIRVIDPTNPAGEPTRRMHEARPADPNLPSPTGDVVELSGASMRLAGKSDLNDIRAGLVDSVRRQIDQGEYDSPEKLDVAVDRILSELNHIDLVI